MVAPSGKLLRTPLSSDDVRALKAGDIVSLTGRVVTGRDRIHKYLVDRKPRNPELPFDLSGGVLYHCGPVVKISGDAYRVLSAGPTTSMRVDLYEPEVIRNYGLRVIIGKGGMGPGTLRALKEHSCIYMQTFGGAAVYLADKIKAVPAVWKLDEFGPAEAMWLFEVVDFPAVVTMDVWGNDIHREIEEMSFKRFSELIKKK